MTLDFSAPTWLTIVTIAGFATSLMGLVFLTVSAFRANTRGAYTRKLKSLRNAGFTAVALGLATIPLLVGVQNSRAPEVLQTAVEGTYDLKLTTEEAKELLAASVSSSSKATYEKPIFRGTAQVEAAGERLTLLDRGDQWLLASYGSLEEYAG